MDTEEAVERAVRFLEEKAGYYTHRLVSVRLDKDRWHLEFDVGALLKEIVKIVIDDKTGRVVEFERPEY
ncbi:hypothetical protein [Candidatus Alkanophaga liquidiphilum]|nr:hypothetical protein [Candidatus Alkanophaga liquidiphilum]MDF2957908.1 hypothetical protein [Candidatus Alkanophaga volatiphilum]RLG36874.1 MAG: hypothetical protein DRN91_06885 [Candidatus Alkanophagales archaeon]